MSRPKTKVQSMDLITRKYLLYLIDKLETLNKKRDQALISILYLTGARISEIVKTLKVYDIGFEPVENVECIVIYNIPCLKRRKGNEAKRNIGFPISKDHQFINYIQSYIKDLNPEQLLFNMGRRNAYYIVRKLEDKFFPHYFRHLRISHLTTMYGFNSAHLRQLTGWTNDAPASQYVHLNWKDNAKKMIK